MSDSPAYAAAIAPYLSKWAKPTEYERADARRSSTPQEIQAFYDAAVPHLGEMLKKVDEYPIGHIPDEHKPVFHLLLSVAEVAPNVEFYKCNPGIPFAFEENRLVGGHCATAD